jgi:histone H3/H4
MDKLGYQKKTPWLFPKKAVKRVIKKTAVKKPRKPK